MDLPEDEGAMDLPDKNMTFNTIEFKNVRFKYRLYTLIMNNARYW